MARATWLMMATMLLPAVLAGCVKPFPDETPPTPHSCSDDCGPCSGFCSIACDDCCGGCGQPPTPTPWTCPVYETSRTVRHSFTEPCWAPPPAPPLLAPIEARLLIDECADCGAVALATDGARLFAATNSALFVAEGASAVRVIPLPAPARGAHVAADIDGAWVVALADGGALPLPAPQLALARYVGGSEFASVATPDAIAAPPLALTHRAYVAPVGVEDALVVLDAGDAAWAVRFVAGAFGAPERLTPIGGKALVGAPVVDREGRVLVPYAFTPQDAAQMVAPMLAPASVSTSLHFAALGLPDGQWTAHGGMVMPQGIAAAPSLAIDRDGRGAFTWLDASGRIARIEVWDDASAWSTPGIWPSTFPAAGPPASALLDMRPTLAWWQEDGTLVVSRSDGSPHTSATQVATWSGMPGEAALALLGDGRAVVAWLTEQGELWAGIEGGALPIVGCGDTGHCATRRYHL